MEPMTFSEHDIETICGAIHNHAMAKRITAKEAYDLNVKLLSLIGQTVPYTFEELSQLAHTKRY